MFAVHKTQPAGMDTIQDKVQQWVDEELAPALHKLHNELWGTLSYEEWSHPAVKFGTNYATVTVGTRGALWGFVSLVNKPRLGAVPGTLLLAAGRWIPAKGSRGNVLDGTARYGLNGPLYMNEIK